MNSYFTIYLAIRSWELGFSVGNMLGKYVAPVGLSFDKESEEEIGYLDFNVKIWFTYLFSIELSLTRFCR